MRKVLMVSMSVMLAGFAALPVGGANLRPAPACTPDSPAMQAIDQILRAYERGDALSLQERLAPDLPGLGAVFEAMTQRRLNARDTRVHITEQRTQCGPDVAIIDFAWEKRALVGSTLTPHIERGRSAFLFSGLGKGLEGPWRVSAVSGDNLFLGGAGVAGILRANPSSASYASVPPGCVVNSSITASTSMVAPPTATASITAGGACSVTPLTFTCDLSGSGIVPTSVSTTATPTCTATTLFTPVPASGSVSYSVAGSATVSAPPGGTVSVTVPYTITANPSPTMVGPWSVTSSGTGVCSTTVTLLTSPLTCTPAPGSVPALIEVFDPDLSGPTVAVQVAASNGDSETFTFVRVDAGRYRLTQVPVLRGIVAVAPGNGRLDLPGPSPGAVTLTFTYLDTEPGGSAPQQPRTATLTLTP
jgi:hypothetical protein